MRKNGWVLAMAMVLTLILSACGGNNGSGKTADSSSGNSGNSSSGAAASPQASAEPAELTYTHALGEVTVKKNPKNVVVFDFGALDTLDKLGVEIKALPKANIPAYLSKYEDAKYENVGSLQEPDFEKINSLSPELIIISGRQQEAYAELSKIAPTLYVAVDNSKYMESFKENTKRLAEIFGKETEADSELAAIDQSVQDLHDRAAQDGKKALVILANEGKISAYGSGSRFGLIHDVFGYTPADSNIEVSTHGQSVNFEYVAERNPDYLFVVDRGAVVKSENGESSPAKETVENELVQNTNAFKNGKIVYLDPNYWYLSGGGLISVSEMVKEAQSMLE